MVPERFNMVDMGGIDIIESQGEKVNGLYNKLRSSMNLCRYTCLYKWGISGIPLAPTFVELELDPDDLSIVINGEISVLTDDTIKIYPLERLPTVTQLSAYENGSYSAPEGYDGFNPVLVHVSPRIGPIVIRENGTYTPPAEIDGFSRVVVEVPLNETFIEDHVPPSESGNDGDTWLYVETVNPPEEVTISVTGGYNGGATISILFDSVQVFTATSLDAYNEVYNNYFDTVNGIDILVSPPPTIYSKLIIDVGYIRVEVDHLGSNTSYGYNYTYTTAYSGRTMEVVRGIYYKNDGGWITVGDEYITTT